MDVRISEPSRLLDLAMFLSRIGLASRPKGMDTLEVHVARPLNAPRDPMGDRVEIVRGLRNWCAVNPGVRTDLL